MGSDTVFVMKALHPVRKRYVWLRDVIESVTVHWQEHELCCLQIGPKLVFRTCPDHHGCHLVAPEQPSATSAERYYAKRETGNTQPGAGECAVVS